MYASIEFNPKFRDKLKKLNVRVQKSFKIAFEQFTISPFNSSLNNHQLKREWAGCRSIDVNADYRAVYEEIQEGEDLVAYFITIGAHEELYR